MSLDMRRGGPRTWEAVIATMPRAAVGTLTTVLAGATPRPRERARLRAVGPWLCGSIVPTYIRPRMVRDRSPGRLGADGEVTEMNFLSERKWVGKGLNRNWEDLLVVWSLGVIYHQ